MKYHPLTPHSWNTMVFIMPSSSYCIRQDLWGTLYRLWMNQPCVIPKLFNEYWWDQRSNKVTQEFPLTSQKFLKFACGQNSLPNWEILLDGDMIIAYTDKCKQFKIEADGQICKLDAIDAGLTFIRRKLFKDDPNNSSFQRAMRMSDTIKGWKATLRKDKTKYGRNDGTLWCWKVHTTDEVT